MVIARERERKGVVRLVEVSKGGENGNRKDLVGGDGHMLQCAGDVLLNCTLETCMIG